jgi:hypothetical protein
MMALSHLLDVSIEEAPLFSSGLLSRATAALCALAALTLAITAGGHWLGQRIALGGHTDRTTPVTITIGTDSLRLAANTIRFPSERVDGLAERVDLYLTWPQMNGYSETDSARFNDVSQSSSLIFLQISQATMSRDMSGRVLPIYSHVVDGDPFPGPHGLTGHRLHADAGYKGETLLTATRPGEPDYAVRCILPSAPDRATSGDCQRDVKLGKDLSILYRFSSASLGEWKHIDAAIRTFVEDRLVKGQPGAANALAIGE